MWSGITVTRANEIDLFSPRIVGIMKYSSVSSTDLPHLGI